MSGPYATGRSNPVRADRVPGRSATHAFEPCLGQDLVSDAPGDDEGDADGLLRRRGLSLAARIGAAGLRRLQLVDDRDVSAAGMLNGTAAPLRGFAAVDSYSPHSLALMEVFSTGTNGSATSVVGTGSGLVYGSFITLQLGFALMIPFAVEVPIDLTLALALALALALTLALALALALALTVEVLIERGPREALIKLSQSFFGLAWVFSLFAMQTKGWNFANAITYGRASYVATGRGYQVTLTLTLNP